MHRFLRKVLPGSPDPTAQVRARWPGRNHSGPTGIFYAEHLIFQGASAFLFKRISACCKIRDIESAVVSRALLHAQSRADQSNPLPTDHDGRITRRRLACFTKRGS